MNMTVGAGVAGSGSAVQTLSGAVLRLPCVATGRPAPRIAWYRDHRQLPRSTTNNHTLIITGN